MIKHVVMWTLQEGVDDQDKQVYGKKLKERLEALKDKIPAIKHLEVGYDFSGTEHAADIILYSEFETKEDLVAYQDHPAHREVIPFVKAITQERRIVDYEG